MRFTGNALESQTATMTVFSPFPVPLDCYPFTLTGTSQREVVTVTNVPLSLALVATRPPTLYIDSLTNSGLRLRGLGATTNSYQIQATTNLANPAWTSVGSSTADANGRFTFLTSQTSNSPVRFYRAVTP